VIRIDLPVLAAGSRVVRQVEDGRTSYVVRAGATGKYLRVGEPEATLLGLMDGTRTLEGIRKSFVARTREGLELGDLAEFIFRMRASSVVEPTAEGRNLLLVEKARQRRKERMFMGRIGSLFFMRVKLLDPDALFTRVERRVRFVFTRAFLVCAALLVAVALMVLFHRSDEVAGRIKNFVLISAGSGADFIVIWMTALCIVCLHETGHGVACKHWGGEVHEMGFLLLFFNPCFYCNVNDAWTFDSRASRLWVTAAGSFVEVLIGSVCVLVWACTEPGSAVHGGAYLVFMISLSGTLLFNMNPLIKLDGYYLLADLLRVENLRDRSMAQIGWLFRGKILGKPAQRVTADRREAWILSIYGLASTTYQALLLITILTILVGAILGGGGVGPGTLAILGFIGWMMLKKPLMAAVEVVMQVAKASAKRWGVGGTLVRVGVAAGALAGASFLVPWTVSSGGGAMAEPWRYAEVRSPLEGIVGAVLVAEGAKVAAGDPLVRIDSPEERALALMDREVAARLRRDALRRRSTGDAPGADATEKEAEAADLKATDLEERLGKALVTSPIAGVVLSRRPGDLVGAPVHRESPILRIGDLSRIRFRAVMDARRVGPVQVGMEAVVRLHAFPGDTVRGKVVSVSRQPLDERDERLKQVTGPHWEVVVEVADPRLPVLAGMTGDAEVILEHTTLAGAFATGFRGTVRGDLLK
jgi:multidrug efflux pump subunit AcrA (membrane-fusion protein)